MAGTLRYTIALVFLVVFFAVPDPDPRRLTLLETRSWLIGDESPYAALVQNETIPPVAVEVLPPLEDAAVRSAETARYASTAREWARAHDDVSVDSRQGFARLQVRIGDAGHLAILQDPAGAEIGRFERAYPDRSSLVPAFLAIVLAILTGKVIPSLLLGCLAGAMLYRGDLPGGAWHFAAETVWRRTLTSDFNLEIMGFVIFLFAAVGVMSRSGGIQGMVETIRKLARGPVSTQLCSYVVGLLIFFDDYSNCVIAGTTMRPLADRNRVSREKLAYIVDSTAAPVAGLSIFSTWVAYEVSMFAGQLPEVTKADGTPYSQAEGFSVFVQTLPYRFYCLLSLLTVLATIVLRREIGPMVKAERRAVLEGKPIADDAQPMVSKGFSSLRAPPDAPLRARNAFVPVLVLVCTTILLIYLLGYWAAGPEKLRGSFGENLRTILNNTASQRALLVASGIALLVAALMAWVQRILGFREIAHAAFRSAHSLLFAVVILVLAWSIGHTCDDLGTAPFLTAAFHGRFEAWVLPALMFALAALVSFSTGTSYGTMAILLPNIVVLAHSMGEMAPGLGGPALMVITIGAVLEGSIFGDHCSPISDTTVLSSVATGSDHLHHVRTQAPYALLTMAVAMVCGYLPVAYFSPDLWPFSLVAGVLTIGAVLLVFGKRTDAGAPASTA